MATETYLLSIDQGTTSSRAMLFDLEGRPCFTSQQEFAQHFPEDGWVEHDPEEIWQSVDRTVRNVLAQTGSASLAAIGITNQRETTVIWERATGKPIYPAIVWQDRRTADFCDQLKAAGHEAMIQEKTGLLLDPYFSASKIRWILDHVEGARQQAERGELAFGTIDSFLLWRLTEGRSHLTDATNASRTLMFNIHTQQWDDDLLNLFDIPKGLLPSVKDCAAEFGHCHLYGDAVPVTGIAGDQQAALIGQACLEPGMVKSTYGTGCFMIMNTGDQVVRSRNRLLSTVAYRLNGRVTYGIEGSIFVAGAAIQWLRDGLKLIRDASETEAIARQTATAGGVYLVPAFTGLGAPYWDPKARGAIVGLTRDTGINEIVTAGLQAVAYQTLDLVKAMERDGTPYPPVLKVDGGMVVNDWLVQFLADILGTVIERPRVNETTALGAAWLAAVGAGVYPDLATAVSHWTRERCFQPTMEETTRQDLYRGWLDAVEKVRTC